MDIIPLPFRFPSLIRNKEIVYNHGLAIYLLWLDVNPVLDVVDTQTHSQNAVVLWDNSVEGLRDAFLACWSPVYPGYLMSVLLHQKGSFDSNVFTKLAEIHGFELQMFWSRIT